MNVVLGIVLYFMIWWMTLFAVLPFAGKSQAEAGSVVDGTPESAPERPAFLKIFLINSVIAAVFFSVVWFALENDWLGLRVPSDYVDPSSWRR